MPKFGGLNIALIALALATAGCGYSGTDSKSGADRKEQTSESPSTKAAESGAGNGEVTIDGPAQQRANIRVETVALRQVPQRFTAAGQITVNEDRTVHIGTYTDGRVTEVLARVGDAVRRNQVLARIHSHALHETRADYETAVQQVTLKENAVAYSKRLAARMRNLFAVKSASAQEVERAEADVLDANIGLNNARITATKEREHLADILRIEPSQVAENVKEDVDLVPILSSIAGTVIDRKVTPGSVVQSGEEMFTVSDLSSVWMLASVNERDIGKLKVGRHARVLTQAFPESAFPGNVARIGAELDAQTRTLQVRIAIPNPRLQLRPEMFANAEIEEGPSRGAIFISEEAIQDINGGAVVFLRAADNKFTARQVRIAQTLNGEAEIQSGLKVGDHVVTKGSFVVKSEMLKSQISE